MRIFVALMIAMTFVLSAACQHSEAAKPVSPKYKTEVRYCFY
jgi:hypothetical protein